MKLLGLSAACLLFCACTGIRAQADFEEGLDFSIFETFALTAPPEAAPGLPSYSEIRGREINGQIAARFEARGYRRVRESEADLIFVFDVAGEWREEVRSSGGGYYGGYHGGGHYRGWYGAGWYEPNLYTVSYVQGTLIIDAFDRARQRLVWHGWSSVSLDAAADNSDKGRRVVDAVIAKFPGR